MLLNLIFAALAILSFALLLWQFVRRAKISAASNESPAPAFAPAISILKPLKGCDDTTADSLASWFNQNYAGQTQILFGVADRRRSRLRNRPGTSPKISRPPTRSSSFATPNGLGANAKVATLAQLEKLAQHDLILISDADVRVPPDFLANFVAPLRDEKIGLVNCFYRLANPANTAMQWEAVAINADFWSQVLQSQTLKPLDFALGAAILLRRKNLEEIGGFNSLANCLADDYQSGNRIFKNGHRIALCPVVVECWDAPMNWARSLETSTPLGAHHPRLPAAALFFQHSCPTPPSGRCSGFLFRSPRQKLFAAADGNCFFARCELSSRKICNADFTPERKLISPFWLVPVKDLLQAAIWFCAFAGNTVEWRGRKMKLRRDGTLEDGGR